MKPPRLILFVCASNFCLSPLAQGIFSRLSVEAGAADILTTASAGTHPGSTPRSPDRRILEVASRAGIDLSGHRTREITPTDLIAAYRIYAMTEPDLDSLRLIDPKATSEKSSLFALNVIEGLGLRELTDPVIAEGDFEETFKIVEKGCQRIFSELEKKIRLLG